MARGEMTEAMWHNLALLAKGELDRSSPIPMTLVRMRFATLSDGITPLGRQALQARQQENVG